MALQYTVRPISDRTPFAGKHESSKFLVTWGQVLDLLERELFYLAAKSLVIEVDVPERAIRSDGLLRADARSSTPAVRLAFESKFGPLTYATDRFIRTPGVHFVGVISPNRERREQMPDWQHNVYAIAKSLEALRMVDRYGVTKRGEQYTGWKALPPGTGVAPSGMTVDLALDVIAREGNVAPELVSSANADALAVWAKKARGNAHPDRNNGARSRWDAVEEAIEVLIRAGRLVAKR